MEVTIVFLMSQNPQLHIFESVVTIMCPLHIWDITDTGRCPVRTFVQFNIIGTFVVIKIAQIPIFIIVGQFLEFISL